MSHIIEYVGTVDAGAVVVIGDSTFYIGYLSENHWAELPAYEFEGFAFELERAYTAGYKAGYESGYNDGYDAGYTQGFADGVASTK